MDYASTQSSAGTSASSQASMLDNFKTSGTIVVGTVLASYLISKYYKKSLKSLSNWIFGNHKFQRNRRNKNTRNPSNFSPVRKKKRRDNLNGKNDEDDSNESSSVRKSRVGARKVMSYISEEGSDVESSIYDDLLIPIPEEDSTSITYSERKMRNLYLNSDDELVEVYHENDTPSHWYVPQTKEKVKSKLYRQREVEAAKFIELIDHVVHQFKRQRVKNYENFKINLKSSNEAINSNSKFNHMNDKNVREATQVTSLFGNYKTVEKQPLNKSQNPQLGDIDEQSVRLNDRLRSTALAKKVPSETNKTLFSDRLIKPKQKMVKFVPNINELKSKNDYIFFELLSVYTENFVHGHKKKSVKKN